ncbi:Mur ligase family protein [Conexibacter arvalis]|uniref:Lipid II isoglutaminyl synthase (glutamine-hydrolyzing) subunit MurT n=1 Tax=Conexibacter arvalis TaxID=912552 RepID=A0A840IH53_9ACTN|nr:Mur ligase family protein [Conexibacter arvalis]MBB4663513.1 UDP-N-acetylmuramyl tripeptide synthase [Conexibacter arvalis]
MAGRTLGAKIAVARAVGTVARRAGRGGGTSLPGKVLMRLEPHAIGALAGRLPQGSVAISATNGKTTTAAMVASILERRGTRLVHNRAGANMAGGIASTLLGAARGGGIDGQLGLFEVDEFWLGQLVEELKPRKLLLGNLFRDQLDRYGELETIADRWAEIVARHGAATQLVLNADDPLVADLGREQPRVVFFGVEDDAMALPEMQHASDSKHCRRCGHAYEYDAVYLGHLGHYHCPRCGQRRPRPAVVAERVELRGTRGAAFALRIADDGNGGGEQVATVELPLPGLYNVYNALGAAALCHALGVPFAEIVAGLEQVAAAFGRAETISLGERDLSILLIKNPAGANEVLRTLALEPEQVDVLAVLNDNVADGRDVSWVWDADFELLAGRVRRVTCAGTRAAELALRLKYAGVDPERLVVVPELERALDAARADGDGTLFALPTYTALLALRELLARRGLAPEYWQ